MFIIYGAYKLQGDQSGQSHGFVACSLVSSAGRWADTAAALLPR